MVDRKFLYKAILITIIAFPTAKFAEKIASKYSKIVINISDSMKQRVFFVWKSANVQKGDIITFSFNEPHYLGNFRGIKKVVGSSGDVIEIVNHKIIVGGKLVGHIIKTFDPISVLKIPEGYVFVAGETSDSFDSRYEKFGLVKLSQVEGKAFPLF